MKNYTKESFKEKLQNINFPDYERFQSSTLAYSDFINKLTDTIDDIAPMKQSKIKNSSQEWFDGEIAEKNFSDKLFSKFKKTKLHIDWDLYREARNIVESLIKLKKKDFYKNKLNENVGNPKDLWKVLSDMGATKKNSRSGAHNISLKVDDEIVSDPTKTSNIFKTFFSEISKAS